MSKPQTVENQKLEILGQYKVNIPQDIADTFKKYTQSVEPNFLSTIVERINAGNIGVLLYAMNGIIPGINRSWETDVLNQNTFQDFLVLQTSVKTIINHRNKMRLISKLFKMPDEKDFIPEKRNEMFESSMTKARQMFNSEPDYSEPGCWDEVIEVTTEHGFKELKSSIEATIKLRDEVRTAREKLEKLEIAMLIDPTEHDKFYGKNQ